VFVVATDGTISKRATGLAWRHKVSAQVFEEAAVDLSRALFCLLERRRTGPRLAAGRRPVRSPLDFSEYGTTPAPCPEDAAARATAPRPQGDFGANTPGLPTPDEASFVRSQVSWSRITPGWPSRTLPSSISFTTTASPAPSRTPPGQNVPGRSPTRPSGLARSWWFATDGLRRAEPAHGAEG
jgi:hypothetical protein